jgi:hypothetical protein
MYNSEQVVVEFHRQLMDVVTPLRREHDVRICYVNDGSVDHTGAAALRLPSGWSASTSATSFTRSGAARSISCGVLTGPPVTGRHEPGAVRSRDA